MTARIYPSPKSTHRGTAAAPAPVRRTLSERDGQLSHLLAEEQDAEIKFRRARLNVELFMAALQIIIGEANGQAGARTGARPEVLVWVEKINKRSGAAADRQVQRAD